MQCDRSQVAGRVRTRTLWHLTGGMNGQADKQDERDEKHKGGQPPITEASSLLSASSSASADLVRVHGTSVSAAILTSTKEMPQGEKKPKKCYRVPKATIGLQFQCLLKLRTDKN